jgi:hypothetical protein
MTALNGRGRAMPEMTPQQLDKLTDACESGDLGVVIDSLERLPLGLNQQDELGWTPLIHAVLAAQTEVVDFLLEEGARIDLRCRQNFTAIDHAERMGFGVIADRLREVAERRARADEEETRDRDVEQFSQGLPEAVQLMRRPLRFRNRCP